MMYLGVGLSAHSFVGGKRFWNSRDLQTYIIALEAGRSARVGEEEIDRETARRERFCLQLRTCEGVRLTGPEWHRLQQSAKLQAMLTEGLVHVQGQRLCLTPKGFLLADAIAVDLVDIVEGALPVAGPLDFSERILYNQAGSSIP